MIDKINKTLKQFQVSLYSRFNKNAQEAMEMMLMMACGHIFDIFTPNQMAETLGIDKNQIYRTIKSVSIFTMRKLFLIAGLSETSRLIKETLSQSQASISRKRITISVDDTVIDRLGRLMSLTYSWFSGKHHNVVKGQNVIAITIKVGQRIIPLCIRPVGKQGRGNTSKPEVFREMIRSVLDLFHQEGINLNAFPITFDSWYGSDDLVNILAQEGFDQIEIHAKSNYVFRIDGKKQKLSLHKQEMHLDDSAWGCKGIPVARKQAESPTFGKVILVFFLDCSRVKCIMVFGRKLRACEVLSIWKQHHSIEQFWHRLKYDLQIHRVRLRSRNGVYSMVGIKFLAYLLMEKLYSVTGLTFQQIKNHAKREIDICSFFKEHFHLFPVPQRL